MSAWPSTLPAPLLAGYTIAPEAGFIRTSMDVGAMRQRRRYTAQPTQLQASWVFTAAQMASFKTFYEGDLDVGTGWFTMTIDAGAGNVTKDCRFTQPYQAGRLSKVLWSVTSTIEVRDA